ncbi:hypothetical protein EJB05_01587 [Eragrostis curvula]|uniref:KEN domain-containing protein n=1 Tax=Eragrostis curvula TaxID=38414 RepID=A0A5J9WPY8_9POAL|nr:hypothetical protein EJB05_01587 [Eragrostis curvula]
MEWATLAAAAAVYARRIPMVVAVVGGAAVMAQRWYGEDSCTADIDESSAEGLCDANSYAEAKANTLLIQVPVLGTTKTFWRLSDEATRITRKLALILRSHHSVGKYLTADLQMSNIWISYSGSVKLRGVSFTDQDFSIKSVRDDYKRLSSVMQAFILISGGDITKLPPDYKEFLTLLGSETLEMEDEFLIVNSSALLPMKNRTEVFLMLHGKIMDLSRKQADQADKKKMMKILSKLPYKKDWLNTARANAKINQWVVDVKNPYKMTQFDLLRLNRNVRSHLHQYGDDNVEEILYCEWPELLLAMETMLHVEGELEDCDIQNKFGGDVGSGGSGVRTEDPYGGRRSRGSRGDGATLVRRG